MHDNALSYAAKTWTTYFASVGWFVLLYAMAQPPASEDFNSYEKFWDMIKRKFYAESKHSIRNTIHGKQFFELILVFFRKKIGKHF